MRRMICMIDPTRVVFVSAGLGFIHGLQQDIAPSLTAASLMVFMLGVEVLPGLPGCEPSTQSIFPDPSEGSPLVPHGLDTSLDRCGLPGFWDNFNRRCWEDSGTGLLQSLMKTLDAL